MTQPKTNDNEFDKAIHDIARNTKVLMTVIATDEENQVYFEHDESGMGKIPVSLGVMKLAVQVWRETRADKYDLFGRGAALGLVPLGQQIVDLRQDKSAEDPITPSKETVSAKPPVEAKIGRLHIHPKMSLDEIVQEMRRSETPTDTSENNLSNE